MNKNKKKYFSIKQVIQIYSKKKQNTPLVKLAKEIVFRNKEKWISLPFDVRTIKDYISYFDNIKWQEENRRETLAAANGMVDVQHRGSKSWVKQEMAQFRRENQFKSKTEK